MPWSPSSDSPSVTELHDTQEKGLYLATQAQSPWWGPLQEAVRSVPTTCASLSGEGAAAARSQSPTQSPGNNTKSSHPTSLHQEKPSNHCGGDRPCPLSFGQGLVSKA